MFQWPMGLLKIRSLKKDEMFCIQCNSYERFIVIGQTISILSTMFRM